MIMYLTYFESQNGQADTKVVKTLTKEVSKIITDQVKKSLSGYNNSAKKEAKV